MISLSFILTYVYIEIIFSYYKNLFYSLSLVFSLLCMYSLVFYSPAIKMCSILYLQSRGPRPPSHLKSRRRFLKKEQVLRVLRAKKRRFSKVKKVGFQGFGGQKKEIFQSKIRSFVSLPPPPGTLFCHFMEFKFTCWPLNDLKTPKNIPEFQGNGTKF